LAPNAVFPNNWFSTHEDGTVVLYPMRSPSRRRERPSNAMAMMDLLRAEGLFPRTVLDISSWEGQGRYLEGTGSLVIDRAGATAYACLSPRTTESAVEEWGRLMFHRTIAFTATMDGTLTGEPVYHTNVMMALGARWSLVCFEAMPYPAERQEVRQELARSGREIIPFSLEQMHCFVGNALELRAGGRGPAAGEGRIFLSETAFRSLLPGQRLALERCAQLVPVAVPCIEAIGGGGVRCMLAEDFLPR
ncbi:MAG: arginine deiminase-related protein, partial [Flavobacteriales bacterium]